MCIFAHNYEIVMFKIVHKEQVPINVSVNFLGFAK
jgi:hypothetical protein